MGWSVRELRAQWVSGKVSQGRCPSETEHRFVSSFPVNESEGR